MSTGPRIIHFAEGDLLPWLDVEYEGVDITGFTIQLHFRKPNGTRTTKDAVVDDANVGGAGSALFHFEWASDDLKEGDSNAEIEITDASSLNETWKGLLFRVAEDIS